MSDRRLRFRDAVRARPGMYVGDTRDGTGLEHMVWEVVGNVVDQHLMRRATEVRVVMRDGWIEVADDGPGLPIDELEPLMTTHHTTPTRDGHLPHVHLALGVRGVGLAPVNALSERLELETTRGGERAVRCYQRGVEVAPRRGEAPVAPAGEGTTIRFIPDAEIFGSVGLDAARIGTRLQELAWLTPLLRVWFQGRRLDGRGGPAGWIERLAAARGPIATRFATSPQYIDDTFVDLALAWAGDGPPAIRSFVNLHESQGGTHVAGLRGALTAAARQLGAPGSSLQIFEALGSGLVAIVHVGLFAPRFENPSRDHLASPEAASAVRRAVARDLAAALERDPALAAFLRARLGLTG